MCKNRGKWGVNFRDERLELHKSGWGGTVAPQEVLTRVFRIKKNIDGIQSLDERNRARVIAESLARVIAAIRSPSRTQKVVLIDTCVRHAAI